MTTRLTSSKASTHKKLDCPAITDYLNIIESGEVEACDDQRKLCAHVRKVFADEPLYIDTDQLEAYLSYQRYFPFELFPWERFLLALFMCVYREDERPRWPEMFVYLGRGAGKNGFAEFVSFCAMSKANGIPFYDIDVCANSEQQAKITFDGLFFILESDAARFRKGYNWTHTYAMNKATQSTIKYRTDNPKSKDGMRSGMLIFDEIHQYENWDNLNVFKTGLGKKPCPRTLYLTTDGEVRDGPLDELKDKSHDILDGKCEDNGFLPFMCHLDALNDVDDERNWVKANPSLPYLPDLFDEIKREYVDYKRDPAKAFAFATKRMNLPQCRTDVQVTEWENIDAATRDVGELAGMPCVAGIDYATLDDMVGCCLLFDAGGEWKVLQHSWLCVNSRDFRRIKAPITEWAAAGELSIVDDVEVHASLVGDWLKQQAQVYDIQQVGIDMYRHSLLKRTLDESGFEGMVKTLRPSDVMMAQPVISSAFSNHKLAWGHTHILRWATNNAILTPAAHGNYVYGKADARSRKTDPFMALVAAFCVRESIETSSTPTFMEPITF